MRDKPKQKFSILFEWDIYKIISDISLPYLAVESRDLLSKKIFLTIIDLQKNSILFQKELTNNWWSTLAAMQQGKLIIQFFQESKFPDAKGFLCYDIHSEETIIENRNAAFACFSNAGIVSTRVLFEKIIFEAFQEESKRTIELKEEEIKNLIPNEIKISLPLQYNDRNPHFNTVSRFIKKGTGKDAIEVINYLEINSFIAVSYYIRAIKKMENYLLIADQEGEVLEDILLNSDLETTSKDPFFVEKNNLYFIKNKKELHSYEF